MQETGATFATHTHKHFKFYDQNQKGNPTTVAEMVPETGAISSELQTRGSRSDHQSVVEVTAGSVGKCGMCVCSSGIADARLWHERAERTTTRTLLLLLVTLIPRLSEVCVVVSIMRSPQMFSKDVLIAPDACVNYLIFYSAARSVFGGWRTEASARSQEGSLISTAPLVHSM